MLFIDKHEVYLTLTADTMKHLLMDLLCVPFRWTYARDGNELVLNLPEENRQEIQQEIYDWLKIRLGNPAGQGQSL